MKISNGSQIELLPLRDNERRSGNGVVDMGSMDSTDTFASCNTHPFNSDADLTREDEQNSKNERDPTLYVNPLVEYSPSHRSAIARRNFNCSNRDHQYQPTTARQALSKTPTPKSSPRHRPRPLAYTTDHFDDAKSTDRLLSGSQTSLQDSPLSKNRRTRFTEVKLLTGVISSYSKSKMP